MRAATAWHRYADGAMDQRSQLLNAALSPSRLLAFIRRVAGPLWLRPGFVAVLTTTLRSLVTLRMTLSRPLAAASEHESGQKPGGC